MKFEIDQVIGDLGYEIKLAKDMDNKYLWFEYINSVKSQTKIFIIERAIDYFSSCHLIDETRQFWLFYFQIMDAKIEKLNFFHHRKQFDIVNDIYKRCLGFFPEDVEIWHKFLSLVNRQANVSFVLHQYVTCFKNLPFEHHDKIWPLFLQFADIISPYSPQLSTEILLRFISYGKFDVNHLLKLALWAQPSGIDCVVQIMRTGDFGVDDWKSILQFVKDELLCKWFLKKFPEEYGFGYIKLIESVGDHELKIHYFTTALNNCTSVYEFTTIYETYLSYLEESVLTEDADDYDIDQYEKLINNRQIMINNIYLKGDANSLDTWFRRFEIYEDKKDINGLLMTFVEAIKSINPLTCYSNEGHRLCDIWIKYAQIYSSKKDLKTADLIYSKSVTSKFKSVSDLEEIYCNWAKIYVESDNFEKGLLVLESVIFKADDISRSIRLWSYYFEIMEIYVDDIARIKAAYSKMIELKYATPLMLFQFANFLEDEGEINESFKIYEIGLKEFNDKSIRFEIYNNYLVKMIQFNQDTERTRDLFDKSLADLPKDLVKPIIILYSEFEYSKGLIIKSFDIVNDYILSTSLDPIELIMILISKFDGQVDLRQWFEKWMTLKLTNDSLIKLSKEFIKYEIKAKQFERVRSLFEYLHSNVEYPFKDWEDFELEYGDESTFKKMIRFKNQINTNKREPDGFVKSTMKNVNGASNPDAIDIDM